MAGFGGDIWGANGGGVVAVNAPAPLAQTVSYAAQPINAATTTLGRKSVQAALSDSSLSMNAVASGVPTAPTMG